MTQPDRILGAETARGYARRVKEGFIARYLSGDAVLDIGYRGGTPDAQPITEKAIGIELDCPGYDGTRLPFADLSQDAVFASHTLEHIDDYRASLADWYRVLKIGGFLVIAVPHKHLYERKAFPPSRFNGDHKRFYTPLSLLAEIEDSLPLEGYRVRLLRDIDEGFNYARAPELPPEGAYEIELVLEKIQPPAYVAALTGWQASEKLVEAYADLFTQLLRSGADGEAADAARRAILSLPLPPFQRLRQHMADRTDWQDMLKTLLPAYPVDEAYYLQHNPDVAAAADPNDPTPALNHYVAFGYFEGRRARGCASLFD